MKKNNLRILSLICSFLIGCIVVIFSKYMYSLGNIEEIVPVKKPSLDNIDERTKLSEETRDSLNEFSIETIVACYKNSHENLIYSPISLYYSLGIAAYGSEGKTQQELLELLHVNDKEQLSMGCEEVYRMVYRDLIDEYLGPRKVIISSSLWMDKELDYKKSYVETIANKFYTSSFSEDLSEKETIREMENWIENNSNGKISVDIENMDIGNLVLFNTVYFNSYWGSSFDVENTCKDVFHTSDESTVKCDFMHKSGFGYGKDGDGYILAKCSLYDGGVFFVLPDEGVSPQDLLTDSEMVRDIFYTENDKSFMGMEGSFIEWSVPKINTSSELDCDEFLNLKYFNGQDADFSGIANGRIDLDSINQYTSFSMDEYGVETASLTAVCLKASLDKDELLYLDMTLDRPFIYAIFDENDVMITIGICDNPVAN